MKVQTQVEYSEEIADPRNANYHFMLIIESLREINKSFYKCLRLEL